MQFPDRTAIQQEYGGDKVAGIIRLPGEDLINVFSDADGPYADDPPSLTGAFGYRGEGLNGPQRLEVGGNALLERARANREGVRFWYRPKGEPFTFVTWVVVLGRTWVNGVGDDGVPRAEIEWLLQPVPGTDPAHWPGSVSASLDEADSTTENDPTVPEAASATSYAELVGRVERRGQGRERTGRVRLDLARSAAARRAVLVRSGGRCEGPACTGMPADHTRSGGPILDVDHVQDLARGGEDHPRNMIAVCPNCHAIKTRGAQARRWRSEYGRAAAAAHRAALGPS